METAGREPSPSTLWIPFTSRSGAYFFSSPRISSSEVSGAMFPIHSFMSSPARPVVHRIHPRGVTARLDLGPIGPARPRATMGAAMQGRRVDDSRSDGDGENGGQKGVSGEAQVEEIREAPQKAPCGAGE